MPRGLEGRGVGRQEIGSRNACQRLLCCCHWPHLVHFNAEEEAAKLAVEVEELSAALAQMQARAQIDQAEVRCHQLYPRLRPPNAPPALPSHHCVLTPFLQAANKEAELKAEVASLQEELAESRVRANLLTPSKPPVFALPVCAVWWRQQFLVCTSRLILFLPSPSAE